MASSSEERTNCFYVWQNMGTEGSHHKSGLQENSHNFNSRQLSLFPDDIITIKYLGLNLTKSHPKPQNIAEKNFKILTPSSCTGRLNIFNTDILPKLIHELVQ